MKGVERFSNLMSGKGVDRLPMIEWAGWWDKTLERWYNEGLPRELTDAWEVRDYLGLDSYRQMWIDPHTTTCPAPASHDAGLIGNAEEYQKLLVHLYPDEAFDKSVLEGWVEKQRAGDTVVWITFEGFFWHPRTLFGIERHLFAFYDHGDLMHEMNSRLLEFSLRVLDEVCRIVSPSFMTFAEDMSYNNGPMLSKDAFDEFLAPYYRRIVPEVKRRGIIPMVDSDGDIGQMIPWFEEIGIEGVLPLERMAGVDVGRIRAGHPEFRMIGGFDKTIMHLGAEAMREEFERLLPVMKEGRYIPAVDHQTPPGVSLEQYRCYVSLLEEYCVKGAQ